MPQPPETIHASVVAVAHMGLGATILGRGPCCYLSPTLVAENMTAWHGSSAKKKQKQSHVAVANLVTADTRLGSEAIGAFLVASPPSGKNAGKSGAVSSSSLCMVERWGSDIKAMMKEKEAMEKVVTSSSLSSLTASGVSLSPPFANAAYFFGFGDDKKHTYFSSLTQCSVRAMVMNTETPSGDASPLHGPTPAVAIVSSGDVFHCEAFIPSSSSSACITEDASEKAPLAFTSLVHVTEYIRTALASCGGPEWFAGGCWQNVFSLTFVGGILALVFEVEATREAWIVVGDLRVVGPTSVGAWSASRLHALKYQFPSSNSAVSGRGGGALNTTHFSTASPVAVHTDPFTGVITVAASSFGMAIVPPPSLGGDAAQRTAVLPLRAALSRLAPVPSGATVVDTPSIVSVTVDINVFAVKGTAASGGASAAMHRRHAAFQSGPFDRKAIVLSDAIHSSIDASPSVGGGRAFAFALREVRPNGSSYALTAQTLLPSPMSLFATTNPAASLHAVLAVSAAPSPRPLLYVGHQPAAPGEDTLASSSIAFVDADLRMGLVEGWDCVVKPIQLANGASLVLPEELPLPTTKKSAKPSSNAATPRPLADAMDKVVPRVFCGGTCRGNTQLVFVKGGAIAVVEWSPTPNSARGAHMQLLRAALRHHHDGQRHAGLQSSPIERTQRAVANFMSSLPLFRRVIALFIQRKIDERTSPSMVNDACAAWEQLGRLCDDGHRVTAAHGLVPTPSFYFQFLMSDMPLIRHADELAAMVRGLKGLVQRWAEASEVDAEAMWPLVRSLRRWQRERLDSNVLLPHLDFVFLSLFRHYYDEDGACGDVYAAAEESITQCYEGDSAMLAILGSVQRTSQHHRPMLRPLHTYSADPNEALLMCMSQFGGRVPFSQLLTGNTLTRRAAAKDNKNNKDGADLLDLDLDARLSAAGDAQQPLGGSGVVPHRPLLRTEQRGDGTWVVEALHGHIDVLYGLGMLLAASLSGVTCGLYLTAPSPSVGFVVTAADANPTEACVVVPPTPLGGRGGEGDEEDVEALQVLACDALVSCCSTRHVHQALPAALLTAFASNRYHAVGPILEIHQHSTIAKYTDTLFHMLNHRGSPRLAVDILSHPSSRPKGPSGSSSYAPRPFSDIITALKANTASAASITGEELLVLCQFAACCDAATLLETLLLFVPTPALSLAASATPASVCAGHASGAVSFAMVMCFGIACAADHAFEDEVPPSETHANLSYGLDRIRRYFSGIGSAAISPVLGRIMGTVLLHRYTEYALGAMNNYTSAVQQKHLARDEGSQQSAQREVVAQSRRVEIATQRAMTILSFFANPLLLTKETTMTSTGLSTASSAEELVAAYHEKVYLPIALRAVMAAVREHPTAVTTASAAAGHLGLLPNIDCDILTDTVALNYHVLWSIQQSLAQSHSLKSSVLSLATSIASLRRAGLRDMAATESQALKAIKQSAEATLDGFEMIVSNAMQPMLPVDESVSLLLSTARLLVAAVRVAEGKPAKDVSHAQSGPAMAGCMLAARVLDVLNVETLTTSVTLLRELHAITATLSDLTGQTAMEREEAKKKKKDAAGVASSEAERGYAMVVIPSGMGGGPTAAPADDDKPSPPPPQQLIAEANAVGSHWFARLDRLLALYGDGPLLSRREGHRQAAPPPPPREATCSVFTAVFGASVVAGEVSCLLGDLAQGGALPWRCDHMLESRRFLISTLWWQQVPMPIAVWAIAHQVLEHVKEGATLGLKASDIVPAALIVPSQFGLSPSNNSGKQSAMLDKPLFALVCALIPPSRSFARLEHDPTVTTGALAISSTAYLHNPLTANTPEPLRKSLLASAAVRDSAVSMPSVCVSASTPSQSLASPNRHRMLAGAAGRGGDDVVRMSMGDDSILIGSPPPPLAIKDAGGAIESEVFTAQSIAWWEDGPQQAAADLTGTTATTITNTTATSLFGNNTNGTQHVDPAVDITRRLLLEVLAAKDEDTREKRHERHRRRRQHRRAKEGEKASAEPPAETFQPVLASTASGLLPPGQPAAPLGAKDAIPLLSLPQNARGERPAVRLYAVDENGVVTAATQPSNRPSVAIAPTTAPAFMPAPNPMPPFALNVPPVRPHGGLPSMAPGGYGGVGSGAAMPPLPMVYAQNENAFFTAQQGRYEGAQPHGGEGTVFLKMPPPPPHYAARTRAKGDTDSNLVDSPRSEGRVIVGLDEALKAEEKLKRKASKKALKAAESGSGGTSEEKKEKKEKKSKSAVVADTAPEQPNAENATSGLPNTASAIAPATMPPPQHATIGSITNLPSDAHPLNTTEQVQFRKYVDDLLSRNPSASAAPAPLNLPDLPPGFSVVAPSSSKTSQGDGGAINVEHESFMQRLLTQQQAMFEVHQEVLTRNQHENTRLLRDLLVEKQQASMAAPPVQSLQASMGMQTSMTAGSPLMTGALGLTATQQSQLLNQAMDQRDRLVRMNDDILRLQAQNAALAAQPPSQFVHNGPQVVYVPVGGLSATLQQPPSADVPPAIAQSDFVPTRPIGVESATQSSPLRSTTTTAAVNTSQPHALHAGVQACFTPTPDQSRPATTSSVDVGVGHPSVGTEPSAAFGSGATTASADTLRATLMQMELLSEQLARATSMSEDMGRVMGETKDALERSRQLSAMGTSTSEQSAAIEALRRKAGVLQSQLSYVNNLPRDGAPHGLPVRAPSVTDWDRPTTNNVPQPHSIYSNVAAVSPLRQSLLGLSTPTRGVGGVGGDPIATSTSPVASVNRRLDTTGGGGSLAANVTSAGGASGDVTGVIRGSPHKSIIKSSNSQAAVTAGEGGGGALPIVPILGTSRGSLGSSPARAVSFHQQKERTDDRPPSAGRKSVIINDEGTPSASRLGAGVKPKLDGNWEVLGAPTTTTAAQTLTGSAVPTQPAAQSKKQPEGGASSKHGGVSSFFVPMGTIPPQHVVNKHEEVPHAPLSHPRSRTASPSNGGGSAATKAPRIISMGDLIADAKADARKQQKKMPSSSSHRPAASTRHRTVTPPACDERFAMYLAPQRRHLSGGTAATRTVSPPTGPPTIPFEHMAAATDVGAVVMPIRDATQMAANASNISTSNAKAGAANPWELKGQKRFEYGDDIAAKQKSLLIDHTAQRIKGLKGLLF